MNQACGNRHQRGMVLVVGLIFLLLMTIIGATAIQTTTLDERMAGNMKDRNVSFQAAEAALRRAEEVIINTDPDVLESMITGDEDHEEPDPHPGTPDPDLNDNDGWAGEYSYEEDVVGVDDVVAIANVVAPPIYLIQCVPGASGAEPGGLCDSGRYRVTVRAQGEIANTVVILETVIGRP
ncbi:pilus assembly PilX family protein [Thiocystis minor]|uniref:pilus assembly PilX family protein n=1 Tax=Thiocystis minor TaxID=61597 RepID=UPI0019128FB3|nr:PilX N-terminal domain-containing pilus assembly protein [Thiocystis minor]